jgi:hypothetical protein
MMADSGRLCSGNRAFQRYRTLNRKLAVALYLNLKISCRAVLKSRI